MNSPKADVITLTCNGQSPTCCKLQIAGDLATLKKTDPKVKVITAEKAEDKTKR
jgi:hypothetical protein